MMKLGFLLLLLIGVVCCVQDDECNSENAVPEFFSPSKLFTISPFSRFRLRRALASYKHCARDRNKHFRFLSCSPHDESLETWKSEVLNPCSSTESLYILWMDIKRVMVLFGNLSLHSLPISKLLSPYHDFHRYRNLKRFCDLRSLDELKHALYYTLWNHPLQPILIRRFEPELAPWKGPLVGRHPDSDPHVRLALLRQEFEQNRSGEVAYQIALIHYLELASPHGGIGGDFLRIAITEGVEEAFLFSIAWDNSTRIEQVVKSHHPLARIMLAKHAHQHRGDCEYTALQLIQVFVTIFPYIYEDGKGLFERHERLSFWHRNGMTQKQTMKTSRFLSKQDYHDRLDQLAGVKSADHLVPLGDLHLNGAVEFDIPSNPELAFKHYLQAWNQGILLGGVRMGYMILNKEIQGKHALEAYDYFFNASQAGDPVASLALGRFFHAGDTPMPPNVKRDIREAVRLLQFAGDKGFSEGYFQAALLYQFQLGDILFARELYLRAISTGHVFSAYEYARLLLYRDGDCMGALTYLKQVVRSDWTRFFAFDSERAFVRWFSNPAAALATYRMARELLWQTEAGMNAAFLLEQQQEQSQAKTLYRQVFEEDQVPEALRKLGEFETDRNRQFNYFLTASQLGDAEALYNVGQAYEYGVQGVVKRNFSLAMEAYVRADSGVGFHPGWLSQWVVRIKSWFYDDEN